jgi:putative oxidoreductase
MTSNVLPRSQRHLRVHEAAPLDTAWFRYLVPLGRLCFALIFLTSVPGHFSSEDVQFAAKAGVPLAEVLVPLSGVLSLLGGASVLLGYRVRVGALLLALFLIPVTLAMHAFWSVPDPLLARMQMIMFMKNLSLLGAALMLMYFGAGPISIDARQGRV